MISCRMLPLALALAGCGVGSLSQTFPDNDGRFDERLLGNWQSDDHESIAVTSKDARGYAISYTDGDGKSGQFIGRMGRIGKFVVLDVQPDKSGLATNDSYKDLVLPMHTVLFIDSIGRSVHFRMIEPDSLDALLTRQPTAIAHVRLDDALVLTAGSRELQAFLAAFAQRPGVLGETSVLTKTIALNR